MIQRLDAAAAQVGIPMEHEIAGGGSDANIFNGSGLPTAIIASGMTHVHSTDEQVSLEDMSNLTALVVALASN